MRPQFNEMAKIAQAYCQLIESTEKADAAWLRKVSALLPQLHSAICALAVPENEAFDKAMRADLDARFEMYAELRELLGNKDGYWMEFDVGQDDQSMSGSLADDLTDIYCELKHGLKIMEDKPSQAVEDWCSGYQIHWGQHLLDAERHLYSLKSRKQI